MARVGVLSPPCVVQVAKKSPDWPVWVVLQNRRDARLKAKSVWDAQVRDRLLKLADPLQEQSLAARQASNAPLLFKARWEFQLALESATGPEPRPLRWLSLALVVALLLVPITLLCCRAVRAQA